MREPDAEQLEELTRRGTLDDLRAIVAHLPAGVTRYGEAATRALADILARATPADLVRFEVRGRREYGYWAAWADLRPRDVHRLAAAAQRLATFHQSGHVRESAIAALSARTDDDDLAFLLLRLNDWVAPVAIRAATAVTERMDARHAVAFVRLLPIVAHLRGVRRRDVFGSVRAIDALLESPSARGALGDGLRSDDRWIRRECVDVAARLPDDAAAVFLVRATGDRDAVVAARAVDALGEKTTGAALIAACVPLLGSPFSGVRQRALRLLCTGDSRDVESTLRRALFDSASAVRELARYQLGRLGHAGFATCYAAALEPDGPALIAALRGLGECGTQGDAVTLLPFVTHVRATVRAAALRSLARLAPEASVAVFSSALADPKGRVVRSAFEALRSKAHLVERARLESLLDGTATPRAACAALVLLCEGNLWTAFDVTLRAIRREEPTLRKTAIARLDRLLGQRTYTRPTNIDELDAAARAADDLLPHHLRKRLADAFAAARIMH